MFWLYLIQESFFFSEKNGLNKLLIINYFNYKFIN